MKFKRWLFLLSFFSFLLWGPLCMAGDTVIVIPATSFFDSDFHFPSSMQYVRQTGCLGCIPKGAKWEAVCGRVKYRFEVKEPGWYTLGFDPQKGAERPWYRFRLDSEEPFYLHNNSATYFIGSGKHTLTVEANFWIGFSKVKAFVLTRSNGSVVQSIRVEKGYSDIVKRGEDVNFDIHYAKQVAGKRITIEARNVKNGKKYSRAMILPKGNGDGRVKGSIRLNVPGSYLITVHSGRPKDAVHRRFKIQVVGGLEKPTKLVKGDLVAEIDCSSEPPGYYGGGMPAWTKTELGVYLESGEKGFRKRRNQNRKDVSWFAYNLRVPVQNVPYLVEVDYPDDALRTFGVSILEDNGLFPSSVGVESGGEYALSGSIQTVSLIRWPTKADMRVVVMNAHNGMKAAISGIRLYRLKEKAVEPAVGAERRRFAEWYEENLTFFNLVGMKKSQDDAGIEEACSRWAQLLATCGVDTMVMPVNAYGGRMYPTDYEVDANPAEQDVVRHLLFSAKKWRMRFIAEFHPMARMLLKGFSVPSETNLFATKEGKTYVDRNPFAPRYNMLYPENQEWLIGLIGDFVDRYKDFDCLDGVSLRFMEWQNSGLYNFHNLDWGYDDFTMSVFKKDAGVKLPEFSGPKRFSQRYEWIRKNAIQEWRDWRGRKVTDIVTRIRDRIRQSRPDLVLYLHETGLETRPEGKRRIPRYERGLEVKYLDEVDGVVVVNGRYRHGRKKSDYHVWPREYWWQLVRDELVQPEKLHALVGTKQGSFLFSHEYLEASKQVVPAADVGFDPKAKKGMWSIATQPAGRYALERYALALAETDAAFLGGGGNNLSFGSRLVIEEFLPEYHSLPTRNFLEVPGTNDSVVVRDLADSGRYYFYVVNRDDCRCDVTLALTKPGGVKSLSDGKVVIESGDAVKLVLQPFEVRAFTTTALDTRVSSSTTIIPDEVRQLRRGMVDDLRSILSDFDSGPYERNVMNAALEDADQAVREGCWWKVRVIMERAELIRIYEKTGRYPVGLRFGLSRP